MNSEEMMEILKEIKRFEDFAVTLESEGWKIDKILHILKAHLAIKFGFV